MVVLVRWVIPSVLVACLIGSACLNAPETSPSRDFTGGQETADGSSTMLGNDLPLPRIVVWNESGVATHRHYVGENVSASGEFSSDPDGTIVGHAWQVIENGVYTTAYGELSRPNVTLLFSSPGDRILVLTVRDDGGANNVASAYLSVHDHRLQSGRLVLATSPVPVPADVSAANATLDVQFGAFALSANASFAAGPLTRVRIEILAPNGTVLNRTDSAEGPLVSVAAPIPGIQGNYTARIELLSGPPLDYRFEYTAWYGYSV